MCGLACVLFLVVEDKGDIQALGGSAVDESITVLVHLIQCYRVEEH
jgi:hypothetical protein